MSKLVPLKKLFRISYGTKLDFNKMDKVNDGEKGILFISRSGKNFGIAGIVKPIKNKEPYPDGLITVALGGSALSSFVQQKPFYTAQNIMVLTPLRAMSLEEKLFYCMCIQKNKYRYIAFGREANRSLPNLEVPENPPSWVNNKPKISYGDMSKPLSKQSFSLKDRKWKWFVYDNLFEVKKGKRVIVDEIRDDNGKYNFISAIDSNNGLFCKTNLKPNQKGNIITVNYDGNGVAEAFYQSKPFWALDSVNVLYPKFPLNPFIAMFLITIIRKEKYRFNYGRKWHKERMEKSKIKLPIDKKEEPDWNFMKEFVKGLPYSSQLA